MVESFAAAQASVHHSYLSVPFCAIGFFASDKAMIYSVDSAKYKSFVLSTLAQDCVAGEISMWRYFTLLHVACYIVTVTCSQVLKATLQQQLLHTSMTWMVVYLFVSHSHLLQCNSIVRFTYIEIRIILDRLGLLASAGCFQNVLTSDCWDRHCTAAHCLPFYILVESMVHWVVVDPRCSRRSWNRRSTCGRHLPYPSSQVQRMVLVLAVHNAKTKKAAAYGANNIQSSTLSDSQTNSSFQLKSMLVICCTCMYCCTCTARRDEMQSLMWSRQQFQRKRHGFRTWWSCEGRSRRSYRVG